MQSTFCLSARDENSKAAFQQNCQLLYEKTENVLILWLKDSKNIFILRTLMKASKDTVNDVKLLCIWPFISETSQGQIWQVKL